MPFKKILVATDFDECSDIAVEQAVDLAGRYDVPLVVVHTFQVPYGYISKLMGELMGALQEAARTELAKVLAPIRAHPAGVTGVVRCGHAWEQILNVAREEGVDLIVVGCHGRKSIPRALLGSVAEKVIRLSPVAVLTVRCPMPS
jgi:nucleotide-binding universal stress UspA family protein